ncbi:MAG: ketopantoate reductase family protein [Spirochaetales bacterium]|nr:ketopantoate reductase family protein [Spirochaetales bacterium]
MRTIKSAAIIGAGALGILYGDALKNAPGCETFYLAEGPRYNRIKSGHFLVNNIPVSFNVKKADDLEELPDLIIIAVKNHHLDSIIDLLKKVIGPETIIFSVLNGIDSEKFLEENFPEAHVIYSVALGMDAVRESNQLTYSSRGKLLIGSKDNDRKNSELLALGGLLESCGLHFEIPEDIHRSIWWKWMINIGVNQVSAVTGANYGVFHTNPDIQALMEEAMLETIKVAKASGIDLRQEDISNWYPILQGLGADGKTSMLQDIEAGRPTEAEWFSGRLITLAEELNIEVPVNRILLRIIRIKEAMG